MKIGCSMTSKFNVCSCHSRFFMECIYRGVVIVERLLDRLSMTDQHVGSWCPDKGSEKRGVQSMVSRSTCGFMVSGQMNRIWRNPTHARALLALGSWLLALGSWVLALGTWHLALGTEH